jgi:branched-chain amino acid transport system ATP-binding protein
MSNEVLLSARNLTKRFGGLAAVNGVSVDLWRDRIHAVIGPNGAGKSTLTNLLSGDLVPTAGTVTLGGADVTGHKPEKISRGGLGRSYQKTNIFLPFTVWHNVRLAFFFSRGFAAGGARRGLTLRRSALCADSAAVLDSGLRRRTRYALRAPLKQPRRVSYEARFARQPRICAPRRLRDRPRRAPPAAKPGGGSPPVARQQLHCKGVRGHPAMRL